MYILGTLGAALWIVTELAVPVPAQQWTADDLNVDRPFGNIEVRRTGSSQKDFQTFFENLSDQQRAEIRSRCSVIGSDGRFAQLGPGHLREGRSSSRQRLSHPRVDPPRKPELRTGMQRLIHRYKIDQPLKVERTSMSAGQKLR